MILVTGGAGVMGSVLVKKLYEAGNRIRIFTLPDDPNVSRIKDYADDIRFGNIANSSDVDNICDDVDTVYHLAAVIVTGDDTVYSKVNVGGTRNLVEAAKRGVVKHFIYVSSASVIYPKATPYSLSKRKCEEIVSRSGLPYTIVRPTLVYDKRIGGQEFDMFLSYLKRFPIVPFIGNGKALKRPVFVNDIMQGLVSLCNNDNTYGKTYNFSGGEAISMMDFSRFCLNLLGMPNKTILCLPVWFCKVLAAIMKMITRHPPLKWQVIAGVTQDANLDPGKAMEDIKYNPVKVSEMLPKCFPRI